MKQRTKQEAEQMVSEMMAATATGQTWQAWLDKAERLPATIEFPCGEVDNPLLLGLIWRWRSEGLLDSPTPIKAGEKLAANGLEYKFSVPTTLPLALMAYRCLTPFRRALFT